MDDGRRVPQIHRMTYFCTDEQILTSDLICGLGGDDQIEGLGGPDVILRGPGAMT